MKIMRLLAGFAGLAMCASPAAAQVYGSIPTAQLSVGTTTTLVAAARPNRRRIIVAIGAANTCAIGGAGITSTTGFPLQPVAGASLTILTNVDVYAVCSAATPVYVMEEVQ